MISEPVGSLVKVYATYAETDPDGGGMRSVRYVVGYSSTYNRALLKSKGVSDYKRDGVVVPETAVLCADGRYRLVDDIPIDIDDREANELDIKRQAALSKLTPAERDLLGLTDNA